MHSGWFPSVSVVAELFRGFYFDKNIYTLPFSWMINNCIWLQSKLHKVVITSNTFALGGLLHYDSQAIMPKTYSHRNPTSCPGHSRSSWRTRAVHPPVHQWYSHSTPSPGRGMGRCRVLHGLYLHSPQELSEEKKNNWIC